MEAAFGDEEDDIGLHFGGEFEDADDAVRAGDAFAGGGDHAGFHPFVFDPGGGEGVFDLEFRSPQASGGFVTAGRAFFDGAFF